MTKSTALLLLSRIGIILIAVGVCVFHIAPAVWLVHPQLSEQRTPFPPGALIMNAVSAIGSGGGFDAYVALVAALFLGLTAVVRVLLLPLLVLSPLIALYVVLRFRSETIGDYRKMLTAWAFFTGAALYMGCSDPETAVVAVVLIVCAPLPLFRALRRFDFLITRSFLTRSVFKPALLGFVASVIVWSWRPSGISMLYELPRDYALRYTIPAVEVTRTRGGVSYTSGPRHQIDQFARRRDAIQDVTNTIEWIVQHQEELKKLSLENHRAGHGPGGADTD